MKQITRFRLFNKLKLSIGIIYLIGMFIFWFFNSSLFETIFLFNKYAVDISSLEQANEIQSALISYVFQSMDKFFELVAYTSTILPVFISILAILFFYEKRGYFFYENIRGKSEKKVVLCSMLINALINSVLFYICYLIFMIFGFCVCEPNMQVPHATFDGILGSQFSTNNPYLYYVLEGFVTHFIAVFFYSLLSYSIALVVHKGYQVVLIPITAYYIILLTIISLPQISTVVTYLNPQFIFSFMWWGGYSLDWYSCLIPLVCLIIPIIITIILTTYSIKGKEMVYE